MITVGVTAAGVIGWCLHMQLRLGVVERQCYASEAHQRIILTGLVRLGIIRQDDVDNMRQRLADEEHKRGGGVA